MELTELTMEKARRCSVLYAVQKQMFCAVNGTILDIDNAYLITNRESRKMSIISGEAWDTIRAHLPANFATELEVWEGKTGDELK